MAWSVERKLEVKTLWWVFIVTLAIGGTAYAFATSGAQTVLVLLSGMVFGAVGSKLAQR